MEAAGQPHANAAAIAHVHAAFARANLDVAAMRFLTDFGDAAVLLPLSVLLLLWLAYSVGVRGALLWTASLAICGGCTAALKIYFRACPPPIPAFSSPSGHVSMSTLIYGSLAFLVSSTETVPVQRLLAAGACVTLVLGIAISRVLLGDHTPIEALAGLAIGGFALLVTVPACIRVRPTARQVAVLLTASALALLTLHGYSAQFENLWRASALYLQTDVGLCAARDDVSEGRTPRFH